MAISPHVNTGNHSESAAPLAVTEQRLADAVAVGSHTGKEGPARIDIEPKI
jgi:hypothetical protein